jgi:hypothetical protein
VDCPPIVVVAFNRPEITARVFETVRAARPRQLLLLADGPRTSHPGDADSCAATREVLNRIDWDCEVDRKFEDENLGCGPAVASGLSWAFARVERAIILEDDCLPDASFFAFCEELLERYADDARVMQISGTNWLAPTHAYGTYSYAFNSFGPVWGWATWRRAWGQYDRDMPRWPEFRDAGLLGGLPAGRRWQAHFRRDWDRVHAGRGTWDHQWQYTVLSQHGLAVSPNVNLVSNLGFGANATQTVLAGDLAELPVQRMAFPLRHPPWICENPHVERHFERQMLQHAGRAVEVFRRLVPSHRARRWIKRTVLRRGQK